MLDFEGPYIPASMAADPRWVKRPKGQWELYFDRRGSTGSRFAVVKLDPWEHTLDGFVLLFYDSLYFGLCVKKVGDYFERVGLVEINPCGLSWRTIATEVSLQFHWKRILLR